MEWQWQPSGESLTAMLAMAREACNKYPSSDGSWLLLGRLLSGLGRQNDAINALSEGMQCCPESAMLRVPLIRALKEAGRYEAALAKCDAALDGNPDTDAIQLLRFFLLYRLKRYSEASGLLEGVQKIDPCDPIIFELLGSDMKTAEDAHRTLDACEAALSVDPCCINAIFFKAVCLAKLGRRAAARETISLDRGVAIREPELPAALSQNVNFLQALAGEICAHPGLEADPRGLATKKGRQTPVLAPTNGRAIAELLTLIQKEVDEHVASDAECVPAKGKLVAWAVVCGPDGRQASHTHHAGRLSGVFYVQAPHSAGTYQGPLLLGALQPALGVEPPWGVQRVAPVPGRLVIFPSYVPHATEPSGCPGERISVAFNVAAC